VRPRTTDPWASGRLASITAGEAFQRQGLLLAPLLPVAAPVAAYWSEWRQR
jgi:hypothetical protein